MSVVNYYSKIPKKYTTSPSASLKNFIDIPDFNLPFRMIIVGSSGSGKTNLLMNVIKKTGGRNVYSEIWVLTKNADEPLYNYLDDMGVNIITNRFDLPYLDINDFFVRNNVSTKKQKNYEQDDETPPSMFFSDDKTHKLVVFDDQVNEANQAFIQEFFVRGRKSNVSCIYLSQSYFAIPRIIRLQSNYIAVTKINSARDITAIVTDTSMNSNKAEIQQIFQNILSPSDITSFIFINSQAEVGKRMRHRFDEFLV